MNSVKIYICFAALLFAYTQAATPVSPPAPIILTPTPAPAPAPDYVNLTDLLSVAGPFSTFLKYLQQTKVIETLQNQANNTDEGITLFVPKDKAFANLKKPSLSNLTADQLKQLCLFHALPHYYSLSDFKNLSGSGPVNTLAGGSYTLNFTDSMGTVHIGSGWTNTEVSSSVHSTDPVAIYQVNKVLLPEAIFGTDIPPPAPAPAPVPDIAPVADAPDADGKGSGPGARSTSPSSSNRIMGLSMSRCLMMVVVSAGFVALL
ncbi:FAS1 domain-containing protein [Artemisia annua]|uniref:FAS1 domain-containing protein n=1 Tax=Artemisia annua TaxID=35608 RepID=A0A2U1LL67_ARTAN|nr:FAS1 domain-containing protein [Artemisia annua]